MYNRNNGPIRHIYGGSVDWLMISGQYQSANSMFLYSKELKNLNVVCSSDAAVRCIGMKDAMTTHICGNNKFVGYLV